MKGIITANIVCVTLLNNWTYEDYHFYILKFNVDICHCFCFTEQMRDTDRQLKKTGREIDRDRRELEKEEKKLVLQYSIKKFHTNSIIFGIYRRWR